MKIAFEVDDKIWPRSLLREGRAWLSLYEYSVKDHDIAKLTPGIYSLFSAFEMYLKAFIVLKNSDYAEPGKLKKIGHNFNVMYGRVKELAPKQLCLDINNQLEKYKLKTLDINKLKYPQMRRFWHVDYGLDRGEHTLHKIFDSIESMIENEMDAWIKQNYPKKSHIQVLLHDETERSVSSQQAEKWLSLCHKCRPEYVSVAKRLNWPWCLEEQSYEFCTHCSMPYKPDSFLD